MIKCVKAWAIKELDYARDIWKFFQITSAERLVKFRADLSWNKTRSVIPNCSSSFQC